MCIRQKINKLTDKRMHGNTEEEEEEKEEREEKEDTKRERCGRRDPVVPKGATHTNLRSGRMRKFLVWMSCRSSFSSFLKIHTRF